MGLGSIILQSNGVQMRAAGDWYVEDEVERECRAWLERYGRTTWADWVVRIVFALIVIAALVGYWQVFMAGGELHRLESGKTPIVWEPK